MAGVERKGTGGSIQTTNEPQLTKEGIEMLLTNFKFELQNAADAL